MIHFDGFSLLLIVSFFTLGQAVGWRRCLVQRKSAIANDAALIARGMRRIDMDSRNTL